MQGYEVGKNAMRARIAISGTAASRNFRRNMHKLARTRSGKRPDHGWRSVKKTRYRRVDMTPGQLIGSEAKASRSCCVADVVSERAIGQGLGEMQPANLVCAIEIGERACHAQNAVIAACGQAHGLGSVAQQFLPLCVGLRDL